MIVDRLTKSTHYLPTRVNLPLQQLIELYVLEIVRLHCVSVSIVSDRDAFHVKILEIIAGGFRYSAILQHNFSSSIWWSIRADLGRYVASQVLFWTWRGVGRIICLWLSLPIITATIPASGWLPMRLCMGDSAGHLLAGTRWEYDNLLVLRLCSCIHAR